MTAHNGQDISSHLRSDAYRREVEEWEKRLREYEQPLDEEHLKGIHDFDSWAARNAHLVPPSFRIPLPSAREKQEEHALPGCLVLSASLALFLILAWVFWSAFYRYAA